MVGSRFRKHGLAGAGWADHDHIMATCCGHFKTPLDMFLPLHIVKIDGIVQFRLKNIVEINLHRVDRKISVQKIDAIAKGIQRQYLKALYHRRFF